MQPYAVRGYTPAQFRGAYGVARAIAHGNDGRGVTVAVIDAYAAPTIVSDVNRFSHDNGVPRFKHGQFSQVWAPAWWPSRRRATNRAGTARRHSTSRRCTAWRPAPASSTWALLRATTPTWTRPSTGSSTITPPQIVSNSYGDLGEHLPASPGRGRTAIFMQAAIEGIGLYFSSGDDGDEIADLGFAPEPTRRPRARWVTAVGGTSLGVGAATATSSRPAGARRAAHSTSGAWSPALPGDYLYGSGGGTSQLFKEPWYQYRVVPERHQPLLLVPTPGRAVPDVALDGDPTTGMLVGETQTFSNGIYYDTYRIGGTSVSCPLFAGIMALADQRTGHPHGFVNPLFYALAGTRAYRDIVNPPAPWPRCGATSTTARTLPTASRSRAHHEPDGRRCTRSAGYDDVTGMGTPRTARPSCGR